MLRTNTSCLRSGAAHNRTIFVNPVTSRCLTAHMISSMAISATKEGQQQLTSTAQSASDMQAKSQHGLQQRCKELAGKLFASVLAMGISSSSLLPDPALAVLNSPNAQVKCICQLELPCATCCGFCSARSSQVMSVPCTKTEVCTYDWHIGWVCRR